MEILLDKALSKKSIATNSSNLVTCGFQLERITLWFGFNFHDFALNVLR